MVASGKAQKKASKKECCTDARNLPEEMEACITSVGGVEGLKSRVPTRNELAPAAGLYQALSDPKRLQILHSLDLADLCPCIMKEITELSDSKLSYHLNILEERGLISSSPRQRWRIYMITEAGRSWLTKKE